MVYYISGKDHKKIKMKSNYKEFSLLYSTTISIQILYHLLDIDINKTIYLTNYSGNLFNAKLYPNTTSIELLSNWTSEEYFLFTKLLKQHNTLNGLDNKLRTISNYFDNHSYQDCVIFFKYIRNTIENQHNKMEQLCISYSNLDNYSNYLYFTNNSNSNIILVDITNSNTYLDDNIKTNIKLNNSLIVFYGIDKMLYQNVKPETIYLLLNDILTQLQLENIAKKKILFVDSNFKWAFSIRDIAKYYNAFFNLTVEETMVYLWGDFYYNENTKIWYNVKKPDVKRGFCNYIIKPFRKIIRSIEQLDTDNIKMVLLQYNIPLKNIDIDNITFDNIMTINFPFTKFFIKFLNLS